MRKALLAVLLLSPALAAAEFPAKLGYQGRVLRADGSPESGVVQFHFALFDAAQSGGVLWEETQTLALSDGFYSTALGETTALGASLFDGRDLFLEVSLGGTPLLPRTRLATVPFAMRAQDASNVTGGKVVASELWVGDSKLVGSDGKLTASEVWVGGNQVVGSDGKLTGAAAYSAGAGLQLAGTTFSLIDSCQPGEVLHWNGTTWACGPDGGNTYTAGAGLKLSGNAFSLLDNCSSGQVLKWTGSTWACASDEAGVQGVSTQAPLTGSGTVSNPIALPQAGATSAGYVSAEDWKAFTAKVGKVSAGAGVVVTGTTDAKVAADFGSGAGKVVEGNDPRLTDKRDPKAGSADYIQNQTSSAQAAGFKINGAGTLGSLTVTGGTTLAGATVNGELAVNAANDITAAGELAGANLLFNGGAESATAGWASLDFGLDGSSGNGWYSGSAPFSGAYSFGATNDGGLLQTVSLVPGATYTLSARMRVYHVNTAGDAAQGRLVAQTVGGSRDLLDKACPINNFDASPNLNKYMLCAATITAPATADAKTVDVQVGFRAEGSTHTIYVDDVSLVRGAAAASFSPFSHGRGMAGVGGPLRVGNNIFNVFALYLPTTGSTNGYSTAPLHLKTNWTCGVTHLMYNLEFKGHVFMGNSEINAVSVGYLYGSNGFTYEGNRTVSGVVTADAYCASDNKLTFKLTSSADWHASDLTVNLIGGLSGYHLTAADTIQFIDARHSSSNL